MRKGILASTLALLIFASTTVAQTPNQKQGWLFSGWFGKSQTIQTPPSSSPIRRPSGSSPARNVVPANALVTPRFAAVSHEQVLTPVAPSPATAPIIQASAPISIANATYAQLLEISGHDRNYSWITGVLTRKANVPGVWFIHYLPPDAVPDFHGGMVALEPAAPLRDYREGELVTINGYILLNTEVTPNQRMTAFLVTEICRVK